MYPEAELIRVVLDNLNTHAFGSLFATYPPEEAWRLARRLEFHFTPKHASWLNMAECELSVLARQCLDRRVPGPEAAAGGGGAGGGGRRRARRGALRGAGRPPEARPPLPADFIAADH